jgi:DNA-binding PadR family transcriptional regulator
MTGPLCSVVLSMLERQQLRVHEIGQSLESRGLTAGGTGLPIALMTLERLCAARLVRRRQVRSRCTQFALTDRGRRELRLQRMLWLRAS